MHRWHAHGGGSEETPQVRPRCTDGKDGHNKKIKKIKIIKKKEKKKGILDGASAPTGSSSAGCAVGGDSIFQCIGRWSRMDCMGTWGGALYHSWYRKS